MMLVAPACASAKEVVQSYPCHFTEVMGIAGFYIVMGGFTKIIFYMALASLSMRRVSGEMYPTNAFEPAATPNNA